MTLRLGLCCQFLDSPIRFRTATHCFVSTLSPAARRTYLAAIAADNGLARTADDGGRGGEGEGAGSGGAAERSAGKQEAREG